VIAVKDEEEIKYIIKLFKRNMREDVSDIIIDGIISSLKWVIEEDGIHKDAMDKSIEIFEDAERDGLSN